MTRFLLNPCKGYCDCCLRRPDEVEPFWGGEPFIKTYRSMFPPDYEFIDRFLRAEDCPTAREELLVSERQKPQNAGLSDEMIWDDASHRCQLMCATYACWLCSECIDLDYEDYRKKEEESWRAAQESDEHHAP